MPLVKLYLRKGKSPEYVRSVADAVHEALVAAATVAAAARPTRARMRRAGEVLWARGVTSPIDYPSQSRSVALVRLSSMTRLAAIALAALIASTAGAQAPTNQPPPKPKPGTIIERPEPGRITTAPEPAAPSTTPSATLSGQRVE